MNDDHTKLVQRIIDSDLSTDERAVLLSFVFDRVHPNNNGSFRWKAVGQWTGFRKQEVLEIRDRLVDDGWLQPIPDSWNRDRYTIPDERYAA